MAQKPSKMPATHKTMAPELANAGVLYRVREKNEKLASGRVFGVNLTYKDAALLLKQVTGHGGHQTRTGRLEEMTIANVGDPPEGNRDGTWKPPAEMVDIGMAMPAEELAKRAQPAPKKAAPPPVAVIVRRPPPPSLGDAAIVAQQAARDAQARHDRKLADDAKQAALELQQRQFAELQASVDAVGGELGDEPAEDGQDLDDVEGDEPDVNPDDLLEGVDAVSEDDIARAHAAGEAPAAPEAEAEGTAPTEEAQVPHPTQEDAPPTTVFEPEN